jgi:predicted dehydrogenase
MKRVAIIGHTGAGDYGHYLDQAFTGVDGASVVAVADPDQPGREAAMRRSGAIHGYADYRAMLEAESPDIVVVATHEMSGHVPYVEAAAEKGAHIYLEKPMAATVGDADRMISACDRASVLLVLALPWRGRREITDLVLPMIRSGRIGEPRVAHMYGFGSELGGDQWFIDLYPHLFDLVWRLYGDPLWCQAAVTQDGKEATREDIREGAFGMGRSAGNGIWAHYQFNGINATFESFVGDGKSDGTGPGHPFRIDIHGTAGTLSIPGPFFDGPDVYFHRRTNPSLVGDDQWEVLAHDASSRDNMWIEAHHNMARSMIDLIDGRNPEFELCDGRAARSQIAMAMAARLAHIKGGRVYFPLKDGQNPFDDW